MTKQNSNQTKKFAFQLATLAWLSSVGTAYCHSDHVLHVFQKIKTFLDPILSTWKTYLKLNLSVHFYNLITRATYFVLSFRTYTKILKIMIEYCIILLSFTFSVLLASLFTDSDRDFDRKTNNNRTFLAHC